MVSTNMYMGVTVPGSSQTAAVQPTNRLYDMNNPADAISTVFQVGESYVVLSAFNLSAGAFRVYMHDPTSGLDAPLVLQGAQVELTPTNTRVVLESPGFYVLKAFAVPSDSAIITMHESSKPLPPVVGSSGGSTGATGATGATGSLLVDYLECGIPLDFEYLHSNTILTWDTARRLSNNGSFTWDDQHLTPTDGLFLVEASIRVVGMSEGTYITLAIMSGLNTIATDRTSWDETYPVVDASMEVSCMVASSDLTNKVLHVQIDSDADLSGAFFWPDMTFFRAIRIASAPAPETVVVP